MQVSSLILALQDFLEYQDDMEVMVYVPGKEPGKEQGFRPVVKAAGRDSLIVAFKTDSKQKVCVLRVPDE